MEGIREKVESKAPYAISHASMTNSMLYGTMGSKRRTECEASRSPKMAK